MFKVPKAYFCVHSQLGWLINDPQNEDNLKKEKQTRNENDLKMRSTIKMKIPPKNQKKKNEDGLHEDVPKLKMAAKMKTTPQMKLTLKMRTALKIKRSQKDADLKKQRKNSFLIKRTNKNLPYTHILEYELRNGELCLFGSNYGI